LELLVKQAAINMHLLVSFKNGDQKSSMMENQNRLLISSVHLLTHFQDKWNINFIFYITFSLDFHIQRMGFSLLIILTFSILCLKILDVSVLLNLEGY
jgi:hypothetical protein